VVFIQDPDRVAAASEARARGCDAAVLDDGFQHRRLARQLDWVLLDATDPWGGGHLLPWGFLREGPTALARAGAVALTRCDLASAEDLAALAARVAESAPRAVLVHARHAPTSAERLWVPEAPRPPESLRGRRVFAACGLGNPHGFLGTLERLGAVLAGARLFPDHHAYSAADVDALAEAARARGAECVAVTGKDAVKLQDLAPKGPERLPEFLVLRIRFEVCRNEDLLWERVGEALRGYSGKFLD
jgi:tetraacyldisaccharide 4'-kinase